MNDDWPDRDVVVPSTLTMKRPAEGEVVPRRENAVPVIIIPMKWSASEKRVQGEPCELAISDQAVTLW